MRADYTLETAGANNIEPEHLDQGTDIQLDKTWQKVCDRDTKIKFSVFLVTFDTSECRRDQHNEIRHPTNSNILSYLEKKDFDSIF